MDSYAFLSAHPKGITLALRVQPRSSRPGPHEAYGEKGEALKWGLNSAPVDGKANEELIESLAGFFSVPKRDITILRGDKGRQKLVLLEGLTTDSAVNCLK